MRTVTHRLMYGDAHGRSGTFRSYSLARGSMSLGRWALRVYSLIPLPAHPLSHVCLKYDQPASCFFCLTLIFPATTDSDSGIINQNELIFPLVVSGQVFPSLQLEVTNTVCMVDLSNNALSMASCYCQIGLSLGWSTTSISVSTSKTMGRVSLKATHELYPHLQVHL